MNHGQHPTDFEHRFSHHAAWHWGRSRKLRHVLFIWLSGTIVVTALAVALVFRFGGDGESPAWHVQEASALLTGRFERAWDDPVDRAHFTEQLSKTVGAGVSVTDAAGAVLAHAGSECSQEPVNFEVQRGSQVLGSVHICFAQARGRVASRGLVALGVTLLMLWTAAASAARKLARPLSQLIAVTREMGAGNLGARVRLGRHGTGELKVLADSVNDMGRRIERQLRDQRELLAVVSHEVRSPLARIRVGSELIRSHTDLNSPAVASLDALDQEVHEVDTLLGKLLAHSRLDFEALSKTNVAAADLVLTVLQRHGLTAASLDDESAGLRINVDSTLLSRALDNLLDNAERYGKQPIRCRISRLTTGSTQQVAFEVSDRGAGFQPSTLPRVFEAFYRTGEAKGAAAAGLGLGLSLVQRIAVAHGGRAWARNLDDGGALVAFSVNIG
ncbi:MAG TPA: HAMP domain-containing sensor histidine kinase [Polyangiaceae bacterium]|jgi:signal transduction histidine kinase|nr:HAMP domain-containing sensor histidine kinase [Polyangiaceae bacterium]